MFDLSRAVTTARSVITANSPALLVGSSVVGVVSTGILAAKGGYKARGIVDEARMRKVKSPEPPFDTYAEYKEAFDAQVPELPFMEKVQLTWLCYAVPAVTGASSIASVLGLHTIHNKRHAAMAGLYAVTANKLDTVQEEAEKLLGTKKTQELNNSLAQKSADQHPVENHEVILLNGGRELCYDEFGGRWFNGSHAIIERAFAQLNEKLADDGEASLNDFYDFVGLEPNQMGVNMGWSGRTRVQPRFGTAMTKEPEPRSAISFRFHSEPKENMGIQ